MMLKKVIQHAAIALLTSATAPTYAQNTILTIAGSNTIGAELAPACAAGYLTDVLGADSTVVVHSSRENEFSVVGNTHQEIVFKAHGTSTGFRALKDNTADIAMASRSIKSAEKAALRRLGNLDSAKGEHTIAIDGLAIIVHPSNPIKKLTIQQLADIYSGKIANWNQLNGFFDAPIKVLARDTNSGTWDTFKSLVLKDQPLVETAVRLESNATLAKLIETTPTAIGFTSLAATADNTVLALADDDTMYIQPSKLSVASEDYLLSRRLFLYTAEAPTNTHTKAFVDYCLSKAGQDLVAEVGYIPQQIEPVDYRVENSFPVEYKSLAMQAKRLSVNFRFAPLSASLDTKAVRDLERLVDFHKNNPDHEITLVGFSDTTRNQSTAKMISKMRAMAVKNALREAGIQVSEVMALGDSLSLISSDTHMAKAKNGRVEVWIN